MSGFQSARETDLGMERGEVDCRAATDVVMLRPAVGPLGQGEFITFLIQQGPEERRRSRRC